MQKKILTSLLIASFVLIGITGCQKEDSISIESVQEGPVQGESRKELQEEQIQPTEENEDVAETADKQICSLCEEEKICGVYVVEGNEYVVCPDDYKEFAYGMGLNEDSNTTDDTEAEKNDISSYDDYMASITEQSDILKTSLEQETLTQQDMNLKSEEIYKLWDDALNYLWGKLKESLPEEEFSKLLNEQRIWIAEKEKDVEEAGKEVEGGSMYSLVVNMEAAKITEERVYELYELLK